MEKISVMTYLRHLILPVLFLLAVIILGGCGAKQTAEPPTEEVEPAGPVFDPLATPTDRQVIPEVYPIHVSALPDIGDSLIAPRPSGGGDFGIEMDTAMPTEVFRVQIFTSRLYNEANRERAIAEEIFNIPVHLDYEVPYYKLRVGDFVDRAEAEAMISEIRTIGYRNAWVARVLLDVRQAPEFELGDDPLLPADSAGALPTDPTDTQQIEEPR